jgi:hypothetical protein
LESGTVNSNEMKKYQLILLLVLLGGSAFMTQKKFPAKSFYAARQELKQGKNDINKPKSSTRYNYFVFVEAWPGEEISIKNVWLNGTEAAFEAETVTTPFLMEKSLQLFANKTSYDTLIAATENVVQQIKIKNIIAENSNNIPSRFRNFELLIQYTASGKNYFLGSRKLKVLTPQTGK